MVSKTLAFIRFFPFSLRLRRSLLSQRSDSAPERSSERAGGGARRPWRRRRPPRRRACSPMGEHATVERPGRGALLLPRRRRVFPTPGEVFPFPTLPFHLRFGSCSSFSNWLGFGSSPSDLSCSASFFFEFIRMGN